MWAVEQAPSHALPSGGRRGSAERPWGPVLCSLCPSSAFRCPWVLQIFPSVSFRPVSCRLHRPHPHPDSSPSAFWVLLWWLLRLCPLTIRSSCPALGPNSSDPSPVCASLPLWWDFCVRDSSAAPLCARVKATLHTWALTTLWVLSDGNQLSMRKKADAGASPMLWAGLSARARPSRESWV